MSAPRWIWSSAASLPRAGEPPAEVGVDDGAPGAGGEHALLVAVEELVEAGGVDAQHRADRPRPGQAACDDSGEEAALVHVHRVGRDVGGQLVHVDVAGGAEPLVGVVVGDRAQRVGVQPERQDEIGARGDGAAQRGLLPGGRLGLDDLPGDPHRLLRGVEPADGGVDVGVVALGPRRDQGDREGVRVGLLGPTAAGRGAAPGEQHECGGERAGQGDAPPTVR